MSLLTPELRACALLKALDLEPATSSGNHRYQRSRPVRPGVRYWSSSLLRLHQDLLGVQFFGEGLREAAHKEARLERAGFRKRTPQTGQLTFAKAVPFAGAELDNQALSRARRELDQILELDGSVDVDVDAPIGRQSFREFMLASPLADVELQPPERSGRWREADL